jgi:hypothetical protein
MHNVYAEWAIALAAGEKFVLACIIQARAQAHAERRPAAEIRG